MSLKQYLQNKPKTQLIFDFDQTMYTLLLPWEQYFHTVCKQYFSQDPTLAELSGIEENVALLENEAVRRLGQSALSFRNSYSSEFESSQLQGVDPCPEVLDFLQTDLSQYHCFVWTSNMRSTVEPILKQEKLHHLFDKVVTKEDVKLIKPEPDGFSLIFDPEKHERSQFLFIGDSNNDRDAAAAAGIDFYRV